jgi:transcriptional regulator with XRE-family HTH domain
VQRKKNKRLAKWELATQSVLRGTRNELRLKQREVSRLVERAENYVTLIETGQRKCTVAEACELAEAMGVDPLEMFTRIVSHVRKSKETL